MAAGLSDEDDDELFTFSKPKRPLLNDSCPENDEYYEDLLNDAENSYVEDPSERRRRMHSPKGLAEELMAGRVRKRSLKTNKSDEMCIVDESKPSLSRDDDIDSSYLLMIDSLESSPSPQYYIPSTTNDSAKRLMDSIDSRLYSLRAKGYYENDDILDDSDLVETSSSNAASMNNNIRVRCNGTLHTFQISKCDPLSVIFEKLSNLYGDDNNILLQFKSKNINPSDTYSSLGLSTVDILDSFILDKTEDQLESNKEVEKISIKIQTSKKSTIYSIKPTEPLKRIMEEFAAEFGVDLDQVKFTFDGELVKQHYSPQHLDIENDDVIDAVIIL